MLVLQVFQGALHSVGLLSLVRLSFVIFIPYSFHFFLALLPAFLLFFQGDFQGADIGVSHAFLVQGVLELYVMLPEALNLTLPPIELHLQFLQVLPILLHYLFVMLKFPAFLV